jgi:hypothetical protein
MTKFRDVILWELMTMPTWKLVLNLLATIGFVLFLLYQCGK